MAHPPESRKPENRQNNGRKRHEYKRRNANPVSVVSVKNMLTRNDNGQADDKNRDKICGDGTDESDYQQLDVIS